MLESAENKNQIKKSAFSFVLLMGAVSLFSDMTHEGASSIIGSYLGLLGASGMMVGFISGFGQFVGYSLRLLTGYIADKTKKYWFMTVLGYIIDVLAIPLLALIPENGWIYACILIVAERAGKAIKKPAKNTLVSFAASQAGTGKSFAIHEFVDQIGAFLGPLMLFLILSLTKDFSEYRAYTICFAALGIPAIICIALLFFAKRKFPAPENFEEEKPVAKFNAKKNYILYVIAVSIFAFGFVDFPLITLFAADNFSIDTEYLPLLYSGAMLIDAVTALFFGWLYDRKGYIALIISSVLSSLFCVFIFGFQTIWSLCVGVAMWGVGMGAQESIMKATVAKLTSKENRSKGYGIFETSIGIFWFFGSWLLGYLYDKSITAMIILSAVCQLAVIPFLIYLHISQNKQNAAVTLIENFEHRF